MYTLATPLQQVRGIGPTRSAQLSAKGLTTVADILLCTPLRYEDRSSFATVAEAPIGTVVTLQCRVITVSESFFHGRRITRAKITDASGNLTAMWFNHKFAKRNLTIGEEFNFSGKINDRRILIQPTFERVNAVEEYVHTGRLVPMYSSTLPLPSGSLRRLVHQILKEIDTAPDELDAMLSKVATQQCSLVQALQILHFPTTADEIITARERLALEELIALIRHSQLIRRDWEKNRQAVKLRQTDVQSTIDQLPFQLTNSQQRSLQELLADLSQSVPMNRLLIGDVGSGKTIVAGLAATACLAHGHHVALVAPTKMLASQHFSTIQKLLPQLRVELVTSESTIKSPKPIVKPTLYIGTHALLNRLPAIKPALVIIDEQHRFGVAQRSQMLSDGLSSRDLTPHTLTMTATPIPRTLLLTIFAHLQVSQIGELPANRLPTKTWKVPKSKRAELLSWIAQQAATAQPKGAFLTIYVCPFIDTSESDGLGEVASVTTTADRLLSVWGSSLRLAVLHSRLKSTEQQQILKALYANEIDVLVTTPIVEVGVDLPQASAMVIENAERFGLASLHQLRGRVGRAGQQGYCYILSQSSSSSERLHTFTATTNGQELAEADLQQRGAGDIFGTQQHGLDQFRFASWSNTELIHLAQQMVKQLPTVWSSVFASTHSTESLGAN